MKKFNIIAVVAICMVASLLTVGCSDNDLPEVQIGYKIEGGVTGNNGVLNVCNGDTIKVNEVYVVADKSTPSATIFRTDYYWDDSWIGERVVPPYRFDFLIDVGRLGPHTLTIYNLVGANGYSLANCYTQIPIYVHPQGTDLDSITSGK